jgi:hypothetical protein
MFKRVNYDVRNVGREERFWATFAGSLVKEIDLASKEQSKARTRSLIGLIESELDTF